MTPSVITTTHGSQDRIERLQTWFGADCESEWFTIPTSGVGIDHPACIIRALPNRLDAAAEHARVHVRAAFVIESGGARVELSGLLADEGFVTLRDAFGTERLQLVPGSQPLSLILPLGRYFVDAVLPAPSTIRFILMPATAIGSTDRAWAV